MKDEAKRNLVQALTQLIGNKRYMFVIEKLIMRLDISPEEATSVQYLISDLRQAKQDAQKAKSSHRFF